MSDTLIVRLPNWLGDTVMAVPALRALRSALPASRIVLAGPWVGMLVDHGLADVLVTYPRTWTGRLRTADSVRRFGGHTAVLLPNSFESAVAAMYWGAERRAGFQAGAREWLLTDCIPLPSPRLHQIDEYLLLTQLVGAPAIGREPRLSPPGPESEARREVQKLLGDVGATPRGGGRLVGVHLGAAYGPAKVWPLPRLREFCAAMRASGDIALLLGTATDARLASEVAEAGPVPSLVGRDRPDLLPGLLTELDVLVSGDTGVAHLAAALGTPVAALFGPTDPAVTAPRGRVAVLRHQVPCSPCAYRECPIEHPCLRDISAREVVDAVNALAPRGFASARELGFAREVGSARVLTSDGPAAPHRIDR
jgi:lipopolysaccharide heptosyltransferase II